MRTRLNGTVIGSAVLLALALIVRISFGDAFTLEGDDESYYRASQAILEQKDLFAGASLLRDIYSFRYLSTWGSALGWWIFGEEIWALTLGQLLTSVSLVGVTVVLSARILSPALALLAGALAVFNPIGTQFTLTLSPDPLLALWSALALMVLLGSGSGPARFRSYALAGSIFVLAYLTKEESAKHLLPLLAVVMVREGRVTSDRKWVKAAAVFILPVTLAFMGDLFLNYIYMGSPFARIQAALDNIAMWKRMGTVDPFGRPWSYSFYVRRLLFPFGPFGVVFPFALAGLVIFLKRERDRSLAIWFSIQLLIFIGGTKLGQIQERMLQVLIPAASLLAVYGIAQIVPSFAKSISVLVVASMAFIVAAKFDFRWDGSPRSGEIVTELASRSYGRVYVPETIRFYFRQMKLSYATEDLPDISELKEGSEKAVAVVRLLTPPQGYRLERVLYDSKPRQNMFYPLVAPVASKRREYPPYRIVEFVRDPAF